MNRESRTVRPFHRRLTLALGILLATALTTHAKTGPNILLITVDNLGYGDLGCFRVTASGDAERDARGGNEVIKTPRIDRLATEGVRCTNFYTGAPSCTPSRACLLTGRYPLRNGLNHQLRTEENMGIGLRLSEKLIPQYLNPAGYATAAFGKWNLGFGEGYRPTERGFDEYFGNASGNCDYYTHRYTDRNDLFRGTEPVEIEGYSTDLFADAAIEFISRNRAKPAESTDGPKDRKTDRPFFIYLPFNAPHFPNAKSKLPGQPNIWQAPDWAFEMYGWSPEETDEKRRYMAVVTALDTAIGRVLDSLRESGLENNTLVIWYSDNGAFMLPGRGLEVSSNAPLRSGGITLYEGGIRVPAILKWPGKIDPGTTCSEPIVSMDLTAMCLTAAGVERPTDRKLDGLDPTDVLAGTESSRHPELFWQWKQGRKGVALATRSGDWKLVRPGSDLPWELYNLRDDIGEQKNLATAHPDKVTELEARVTRWLETVVKN